MTVTRKVLFNIFSGKESGKEQIIEMLIEENENFFVKIGFLNTLKIMVESIESYDSQYNIINNNHELNENNYILKLNYCKEVLRTFLEIKNTFPEFNKLVADNLDTFKNTSDVIIANRYDEELEDEKHKVYTRDIFRNN